MESTRYIVTFVVILTTVVALALSSLKLFTDPIAKKNEAIFNKRAVLLAVEDVLAGGKKVSDLSDEEVLTIFNNDFKQTVLDVEGNIIEGVTADEIDMAKERKKADADRRLPLYTYQPEGGGSYYILSVRGSGLWDEIWGNMAVKSDLKTVVGVSFDHKGETPGLGAEIKDNQTWVNQFQNKLIYNEENKGYEGILVRKGGAKNPKYEVDGLSGATVTANGVTAMIENAITWYKPYLSELYAKAGK